MESWTNKKKHINLMILKGRQSKRDRRTPANWQPPSLEIASAAGHEPERCAPTLKLDLALKLALLGPETSRDSFQPKLFSDSWL